MDISELDLEGGTFKFTLPYTALGGIGWVVGLLVVIVGIVLSINDPPLIFLIAVGCMVMAFVTPGSFEGSLNEVSSILVRLRQLATHAQNEDHLWIWVFSEPDLQPVNHLCRAIGEDW